MKQRNNYDEDFYTEGFDAFLQGEDFIEKIENAAAKIAGVVIAVLLIHAFLLS